MLFLLLNNIYCWGPVFHQVFAHEYLSEHETGLSLPLKEAFIRGSIYADGIDKSYTHHIIKILPTLKSINDENSKFYWFLLGIVCHIVSDTFAHAGLADSFIRNNGIIHYISEMAICSWAHHNYSTKRYLLTSEMEKNIRGIGVNLKRSFKYVYFILYYITYMPLFLLIPIIKKVGDAMSYADSESIFKEHIKAMIRACKIIIDKARYSTTDDEEVYGTTVAELEKVSWGFESPDDVEGNKIFVNFNKREFGPMVSI